MPSDALRVDRLLELVSAEIGLSDLGEPTWRDGAQRLTQELDAGASLNELGVAIASAEIADYLRNRLYVTHWLDTHPHITDQPVVPPIVIVGQARTGTTILHDLLAQDPANRVPLTWEVDRPLPPPETATFDTDPRIAASQEQLDMAELADPGLPRRCTRWARCCRRSACA